METIDVEAAFDRFLDERLKTSDFAQTLREKSGQLLLAQLRMGLLVARQMKFESSGLEWIAAVLDSPDLMPVRKAGQKNIQLKFLTINDIPLSNVMLIAPDDAGESRPVVLCTVDAPDGVVFRWFESLERLRRDFLQRSANSEYLLRQMPILRQALARQSLAFDEWFEHYRFPQVFRNWPAPIPLPTLVWEVVSFDEQRKHFIDENHDIRVEHMISDAKSYRECAKDSDSAFDFHLAASIVMLFLPPPIRIPLALGMTLYTAWQGFRKIEDNDYLGAAQEFLNALGYLLLGGVGVRSLPSRFIAPIRAPRPAPPLVRRMGPDGCEHIGFLLSPPKGPLLADAKQVTALDSKVFHAVEINHETFYIRRRFNLFGHARLYRQVSDNAQLLTYSDEFGFINSGGVWIKALYRARGIGPQILRNAYRELERLTAVWPVAVDSLSLAEKKQFESLYMGLAKSGNAEFLPNILSYCEGGSASINQLLRTGVRNSKTRKFLIDLFRLNAYQGVAFRVTHVSSACMQQLKTKLGQVFMDRGVQSASITRFNASRWSQDAFITQHANSDNQMIYMIFDSSIPKKNMFSHILGDHVGVVPNTPMQLTAVREVGSNFFAYFSSPQEVGGELFDIYTGEDETSNINPEPIPQRLRIKPMKNSPPMAAVATPMGRSSGAIRVRAATSTHTRKMLPINAQTGSRRRCSAPTNLRAICGTIRPTKPMEPLMETITPVISEAIRNTLMRTLRAFRPRVTAVCSPAISALSARAMANSNASPIMTTSEGIGSSSQRARPKPPSIQNITAELAR